MRSFINWSKKEKISDKHYEDESLKLYSKNSNQNLVERIQQGDKRSASLLMSLIENGHPEGEKYLRKLYPSIATKKSYVIGVTGWPGVGKSTLIKCIAQSFLAKNKQVGIIAIDPTSPFSGGSLLGDRERMKEIDGDERLFIRSAATRGQTGGINKAAKDFIKIMEAMGKEVIILETVGVGQNQVSVIQVADTIILTVIPGMGDYLQSLKAGVLEIGDIFVVNKSDREGATRTVSDLKAFINLSCAQGNWKPPILKAVATTGEGIEGLMGAIYQHWQYLNQNNLMISKRKITTKSEILEIIQSRILHHLFDKESLMNRLDQYTSEICDGKMDPYQAADDILRESGIEGWIKTDKS